MTDIDARVRNHDKGATLARQDRNFDDAISRRRFLAIGAGAVGSATLLAACGGGGGSSTSTATSTAAAGGGSIDVGGATKMTLVNWGGTSSEGMVDSWVKPFQEATGVKVTTVNPTDYGKLRSQVESGNVSWDVVDVEGFFIYQGADEGLLEPLDPKQLGVQDSAFVSNLPDPMTRYGVVNYLTAYVIAYRKDGPKHPTSWAEFFDPKKVPGRRMLYNWPYGMLELALLGDGVPFDQLYPLDMDRAFAKMDAIKGDLAFWNTGAESQQALVSGSADFVVPWNNRAGYLIQGGEAIDIEWNENLQIRGGMVVPKGAPNAKAGMAFIGTSLDPQHQADMAKATGYGPVVTAANDLVDDSIRSWISTTPKNLEKTVGFIDDKWWAKNLTEASDRWTKWAAG